MSDVWQAGTGGVARFLNHSCSPNCVAQIVLTEGDSGVSYHISLFAAKVTISLQAAPGSLFAFLPFPGLVSETPLICHGHGGRGVPQHRH